MGEVAGLLQVERNCVPGELAVSSGEGANEWRSCQKGGQSKRERWRFLLKREFT